MWQPPLLPPPSFLHRRRAGHPPTPPHLLNLFQLPFHSLPFPPLSRANNCSSTSLDTIGGGRSEGKKKFFSFWSSYKSCQKRRQRRNRLAFTATTTIGRSLFRNLPFLEEQLLKLNGIPSSSNRHYSSSYGKRGGEEKDFFEPLGSNNVIGAPSNPQK